MRFKPVAIWSVVVSGGVQCLGKMAGRNACPTGQHRDNFSHSITLNNRSEAADETEICQMGLPQPIPQMTAAEYLAIEREASVRSEFFNGEMFAMSGGTLNHSRIAKNVLLQLGNQLAMRACEPFTSDLRVVCPTGLITYPDLSVICGDPEFEDGFKDAVRNPTLLVEVLSKSTESYDRGKKFDHYRTIDSLREYVLIAQDEPMIQTFLRNDDGTWTLRVASGLDQRISLTSIDCELRLADVYDRVDFSTPES